MIILVIHIILCVIYFTLGKKINKERAEKFPSLIVVLLPIFGFVMWLADRAVIDEKLFDKKEIDMDKMEITDAKYQRLENDSSVNGEEMVPLEEALIINDAQLRRSLLLDILRKNPEKYLSTLERAKASEDVEITHYATTTLLEIQSEYEQKLQMFLEQYPSRKKDYSFLKEYADCLERYVTSGLIDGSVLNMQQEQLLGVLKDLITRDKPNRDDRFLYIETALNLKKYDIADSEIKETKEEYVESEKWNQLAVRYYWETGQTEEINKVLANVKNRNIYLTKEGKEWFRFWSKGKSYEET